MEANTIEAERIRAVKDGRMYHRRKKKIELKPCPFCGGEVKRHEGIVKGIVMFTCYNCGADVCFYGAEFEPKASEVWNRRVEEE